MDGNQFLKTIVDLSFGLKRVFSLYIEREINLTYPQWRVIKTIRFSNAGISAKEIADILSFDKVTISDIVNRLIRKGYLIKKLDKYDRRRNLLSLSDYALSLCKNVTSIEEEFNKTLFSGLKQEEIDRYLSTTNELLKNLNNMNRSIK